ncbi:unnamed protein product [Aphis gossypii]|uniref:Uncharacterized protein n=1 Tax=Aphis gossypii TaxID=80765 RepID=A0A9P0IMA8_APHGO|nr:unnamed protein product [Aphis gossypii]
MEDPEHTTLVPGTLHVLHDRRRGVHCLNVRDLLINNGLPLKFNRTSISGRCEDMGRCVVVHRVPCASRKTLLFGVDHYRNCNRLGAGWQWWWWAVGRVYMKRRKRKKLQKQGKTFATRISHKTATSGCPTFIRFTDLHICRA